MSKLRNEAMARLAAADVALQDARTSVNMALSMFCEPGEDDEGAVRAEEIGDASVACQIAVLALDKARAAMEQMGEEDLAEREEIPDDEEEEEEEEEEDE